MLSLILPLVIKVVIVFIIYNDTNLYNCLENYVFEKNDFNTVIKFNIGAKGP